MSDIYNLDDGLTEYFDFVIFGHKYRFRQPNTEEIAKLNDLKGKVKREDELIYDFITKIDESSPDFNEISKKMTIPHWRKFNDMVGVEMTLSK